VIDSSVSINFFFLLVLMLLQCRRSIVFKKGHRLMVVGFIGLNDRDYFLRLSAATLPVLCVEPS
jgi:hypothetical protein